MKLQAEGLSYSYGRKLAVDNLSFSVEDGEFVGLIGPNGSGKSTGLKMIYRALRPQAGRILLDGQDLLKMPYRQSAQMLAAVSQENEIPFSFTVEEIAAMGRSPHKRFFEADALEDKRIVAQALAQLGLTDLAQRSYDQISGGEKQRTVIARALAQQCPFLVLDEPANHLDIGFQMQIFSLVKGLGCSALAAVHDLNMAALYCDRIYILKNGKLVCCGSPEQTLTPETIWEIYGVRSVVSRQPETGKLSIAFLPKEAEQAIGTVFNSHLQKRRF